MKCIRATSHWGLVCLYLITALCGQAFADEAADFQLVNQKGEPVKLADYKGQVLVIEWTNPDCPYVKRHYKEETMKKLAAEYNEKQVAWVAVNSTHYMGQKDNAKFAKAHELHYPVMADQDGSVGKAYGAKTTPHMFVVNKKGKVVYQGAIDDDRFGEKSAEQRTNYVDAAVEDLLAGKPVKVKETKPYGCSVKYAG